MKARQSREDYLEAVLVIEKEIGNVRSIDVARHMEVSKPSVCHAVAVLRTEGFITKDAEHVLHLTDAGRQLAERMYERHCFFREKLIAAGIDPQTAETEACRMEHTVSQESFERIRDTYQHKNKKAK